MKNEHNNIEDIFKEKLQEFEVMPPEHLWANISQEIAPKKNKRKPFLFWYIGSGIAASLLIFSTLFFNFSVTQNIKATIVDTEKEEYCPDQSFANTQKDTLNTNTLVSFDPTINSNNKTTLNKAKNNVVKNSSKKDFQKAITPNNTIAHQKSTPVNNLASSEILKTPLIKKSDPLITKNTTEPILVKPIISETEKLSKNDVLALLQPENIKKEEKESLKNNSKKWSIQPQVTTFSYNSNGSSINENFNSNPQNTEAELSYGIRIAYQATSKVSIRAGINNANINITTSNIGAAASNNNIRGDFFSNNDFNIINLDTGNNTDNFSSPVIEDSLDLGNEVDGGEINENPITSGKISQQIQYFEIPIELAYNLLDNKIGIDIIGGFSTFILSKNETTFEGSNTSTSLGETSSINSTSYSSNFGFAIDYRLVDNLKLSIEPIIKFQFNSFDDSVNSQPYFIGVSSGLKWNF